MTTEATLWQPSAERIAAANITDFARRVAAATGQSFPDYASLWRWSTDDREAFWRAVWDFAGVVGTRGERTLVDGERMPGARWFPDARLNFAENLLARSAAAGTGDALVFRGEDKLVRRVSHAELVATAAQAAAALKAMGLTSGDRVAAYLPNMPETIEAMLGATSLGAVWSSCSPDFGVQGVLDRFGQIEPRVLVHRRRLLVQRQAAADPRQGGGDRRPRCPRSSASSSFRTSSSRARARRTCRASARRVRWDAFVGAHAASADRVRAAAVRPSPVHPLFVRHDGRAEVHRPWRRRHAAAALEGAPAARRPQAGRPAVLFHDVRLDDVELARVRPRRRARRCCSTTGRRSSTAARCCGISPMPSGSRTSARRPSTSITRRRSASFRARISRSRTSRRCSRRAARSRPRASTTSTSA